MGQNLYTKGACYAAMGEYARMNRVGDYLYAGPDMIEQNMGMEMIIRGHQEFYPMISAGVSWYMARAECEFVLDDTSEVILYSKSMAGEELPHGAAAGLLPDRPNRCDEADILDLSFIGKRKCRVRVTDLGLGNLYPASGKRWDAVITFAAERDSGKGGRSMSGYHLCQVKKARHPYFIESISTNIFTIEELCFYLEKNIYLLDQTIINEKLLDWISGRAGSRPSLPEAL